MSYPRIKDTIQDCNLNFLIGSGLSAPYLRTLGNIETLITDLESANATGLEKDVVRISLYKHFFESALSGNMGILRKESGAADVLRSYQTFLSELNNILLRRKSTILSKEINLFTTNVDVFLEHALESLNLEVNDGFNGRFNPQFSLSHFKTSRFKKSLHFDNVAELPIFNLLKLHGSLSWQLDSGGRIAFSRDLDLIDKAEKALKAGVNALNVNSDSTVASLLEQTKGKAPTADALTFMEAYEDLLIVNPTKEKFKHTLLNQTYYELLRIFSNELEKENTVLFALGFSFADEHIREITLRSVNSNPTLAVFIVAYDDGAAEEISGRFPAHQTRNNNIFFIKPPRTEPDKQGARTLKYLHTLDNINRHIFGALLPEEPEDAKE
jgi:hypothetical protein